MWEKADILKVSGTDRRRLAQLAGGRNTPQKVVLRARIVLGAAEGRSNNEMAKTLGTSRPTVILWRNRFEQLGIDGLLTDAPRPGRKPQISARKVEAVVNATLHTKPRNATHWSVRSMAKEQKLSPSAVHRIWQAHGLQPHRTETFKLSEDPDFVRKLRDVVGLYMNPPDKALVLCVDEKSQIQALDRTQPALPMRPGIPERQTHDYVRHGTTTLFAALNILDGKVIGSCKARHRHIEFLEFMEQIEQSTPRRRHIHLVLDNYGTHKHPNVKKWFGEHPRYHLHFVPTGSSWLNLVECWFSQLTTKRIRRGSFRNVSSLIRAIRHYIRENNKDSKPFIWTASAAKILRKVKHCKEALDTGH
jgi:transposase